MFKKSILLAAMLGLVSVANAASISLPVTIGSDWWAIDGAAHEFTYNAPVADASATFSFQLQGYNTVDGLNSYSDAFLLKVNGSAVAGGYFNLGGGGADGGFVGVPVINHGDKTVTFSNLSINLLQGINTFSFSYSPVGASNGLGQSIGDEAWRLNSASITAAVPEPESYAMFLAGLGLMGAVARRRKS